MNSPKSNRDVNASSLDSAQLDNLCINTIRFLSVDAIEKANSGIADDHGGYELKEYLVGKLRGAGHAVTDFGDGRPKEDDDYPNFIMPLARAVAAGTVARGIAICGSG